MYSDKKKHAAVSFFRPKISCIGLESNPGLFGKKPAIDRLELIRIILKKKGFFSFTWTNRLMFIRE